MTAPFRAALLAAALLAPPAAAADVWKVGPTQPFATIQDAIAIAADGDVILVDAGSYPGFTVAGRSLVIAADAEAVIVNGSVVVYGSAPAQSVTLQGLEIRGAPADVAVRATANEGAVWIEGCEIFASHDGGAAFQSVACVSVVLRRSSLIGGFGEDVFEAIPGPGRPGVVFRESAGAFFSCSITGGGGGWTDDTSCSGYPGGPGGDALQVENATLLLQSCTVKGGFGGVGDVCSPSYCGDGGTGGAGLVSSGAGEITLVETQISGGEGGGADVWCDAGADGPAIELLGGSLVDLPEAPRALVIGSPVREGQIAQVVASGEPSDLVAVYAGAAPALVGLASTYGFQLLEPPLVLLAAAPLPASGILQIQTPVPDIGASVQGLVLPLQLVALPPSGGFVLGEAGTLVLLDSAL